ncbi:MAG TPA: beta-L-arabinofuranosidase domain-containing protein, partial [Candidatus Sulfotelmatobacter sp.]|nr:beta-L-arabinofuranosidase domain-containing protein [Candidatus Sulfotelmatobacter sp.]
MKTINTRPWLLSLCLVHLAGLVMAAPIQPVAFRVPAKMPDALEMLSPADVQLSGMLGERVSRNERNRLAQVDLEPLLAGFRKKPGIHPWIGEHIGKWLHASTLAWANTGDAALRAKMDYAVAELAKAQEPDGYLGTYTPDKRFGLYQGADWDVWSHKYNLIGLLTYYEFTGNAQALQTARKVGDLLVGTFGPGKKSILSAGTHVGMAATSVLEPVVLLYRQTGDERYLEFAKYLVRSWDSPTGPQIIKSLLEAKSVQKTANGKAYEMLSNLVGLCELARATGDRSYLEPVLNAWEDIVAYRLYLTGSVSQGEHFHGDYELPNEMRASVSETCVTTTWIQLNLQLLRLTGEARFGNQLEKTFLNHLSAAQRPDGAQWCYFTSLEGTKPYGPGINCCVSSGPRGMALAPQAGWLKMSARENEPETLVLDLFDRSTVNTRIGGQAVTIHFESRFPLQGSATLRVKAAQPVTFGLRIRTPEWAQPLEVSSPSGKASGTTLKQDGSTTAFKGKWTVVSARQWKDGDSLALAFSLAPRLVMGEHGNAGKAAL